jgi:hypothetical protein
MLQSRSNLRLVLHVVKLDVTTICGPLSGSDLYYSDVVAAIARVVGDFVHGVHVTEEHYRHFVVRSVLPEADLQCIDPPAMTIVYQRSLHRMADFPSYANRTLEADDPIMAMRPDDAVLILPDGSLTPGVVDKLITFDCMRVLSSALRITH